MEGGGNYDFSAIELSDFTGRYRTEEGDTAETISIANTSLETGINIGKTDARVDTDAGDDTILNIYDDMDMRAYGGDGNDTITSAGGDDLIYGEAGDDIIDAGDGKNTVDGGAGNDILIGGASADIMNGGTGNDKLTGGGGDDTLDGGAGDDLLIGGLGDDRILGGSGNDRFVFSEGDGNDYIDGGASMEWTDSIKLQDSDGGNDIGAFGSDWTVTFESGAIEDQDTSSLTLSEDASGTVTLRDGSTIEFDNLERVDW